jgi:hypothetical protein
VDYSQVLSRTRVDVEDLAVDERITTELVLKI